MRHHALPGSTPFTLSACPRSVNGVPAGQDPEKVSRAELDLAQDEWKRGRLRTSMDHAMKASNADEGHAAAHEFVAILFLALCQIEGDCRFDCAETRTIVPAITTRIITISFPFFRIKSPLRVVYFSNSCNLFFIQSISLCWDEIIP